MVDRLQANHLWEGDGLSLLEEIPDGCVHLVLCDLPYNTTQNAWEREMDLEKLWGQYERILTPNGVVILTSQGLFTAKLLLSKPEWFKYKLVWIKSKATNFLNAKKQPLRRHEDVCVFYRRPPTYHPQMREGKPYNKGKRKSQQTGSYGEFQAVEVRSEGGRYPDDLLYFATAEAEGPVWHPTQKPVSLGRHLVKTYTNPGEIVLDHAFGSGSFLVAALAEGRNFVGMELNQQTHQFKGEAKIDLLFLAKARLWETWHTLAPEGKAHLASSPLLASFEEASAQNTYGPWLEEARKRRNARNATAERA